MLLPIPEEVLKAEARSRFIDTWIGSLGLSAAVASASFAAYMVAVAPSRSSARASAPVAALGAAAVHPRRSGDIGSSASPDRLVPSRAVDFDPTGSIRHQGTTGTPREGGSPLADYAVRDVFDGTALIEASGRLQMVRLGSSLEGAGTVLSIDRLGKGWSVTTTGGVITQRKSP